MPFRALYFKSIKFGTLSTTDPVSSCVVPFAIPFSYASRIIQMTNVGNVSTAGPFLLFHIKSRIRQMYEIWCIWKNKNILNMFLSLFAFVCQNSKCIQLLRKRFATKSRKTQKMMLACVGSTPLHNYYFSVHETKSEMKPETWKRPEWITWPPFSTFQDFNKMTFTIHLKIENYYAHYHHTGRNINVVSRQSSIFMNS